MVWVEGGFPLYDKTPFVAVEHNRGSKIEPLFRTREFGWV